jgi:hypothetical protein
MTINYSLPVYSKIPASDALSLQSSIGSFHRPRSDEIPLVKGIAEPDRKGSRSTGNGCLSLFSWWLPEIVSCVLSAICFAAIIGVLLGFQGKALAGINLPHGITLNGIIAAIATLNRAFLTAPVGSALMQELWLFFADEARRTLPTSRLLDLKAFDAASRNAWGSILFLFRCKKPR